MYPIYHFILTVIMSGFLFPVLGWKLIFFWLGSFFIDIDHYWWYIIKFRDFNFKNAYNYSKDRTLKDTKMHIFHTFEFWIILGIWSMFSDYGFAIFLGIIYHIILDMTDMIARKIWYSRTFSFFNWYYSPSN